MSSHVELAGYSPGNVAYQGDDEAAYLDRMLERKASSLSRLEGFSYLELTPMQRLFVTSYRCPVCKLLPLYALNLEHRNKIRCGRCGNVILFPGKGKYGKLRKKVAYAVWCELRGRYDVPR
ncbi:hypothetical protein [Candidatus Nitrososphaera sp. FF02]|uniref:hypothetical protein n=1 Tax=Candidatus Nitrososphaera sp. FF02 TaxID=3398226 RepID=UPI0039E7FD21